MAKYDLVITTYGTLSSEVKKGMTKDELAREGKAKMDDLKVISSITLSIHFNVHGKYA